MTEYEKAVLKLKILELTQRQTLIAITAFTCDTFEATQQAIETSIALDAAVASVRKLL